MLSVIGSNKGPSKLVFKTEINSSSIFNQYWTSQRFTNSLYDVQKKLEIAIDGLRPQRTKDLDLAVPEVLIVGQEMTAALIASDASLQTLDVCNRTAHEIANVTEREASELMNQLVSTLVTGVSVHQREMDRVLR